MRSRARRWFACNTDWNDLSNKPRGAWPPPAALSLSLPSAARNRRARIRALYMCICTHGGEVCASKVRACTHVSMHSCSLLSREESKRERWRKFRIPRGCCLLLLVRCVLSNLVCRWTNWCIVLPFLISRAHCLEARLRFLSLSFVSARRAEETDQRYLPLAPRYLPSYNNTSREPAREPGIRLLFLAKLMRACTHSVPRKCGIFISGRRRMRARTVWLCIPNRERWVQRFARRKCKLKIKPRVRLFRAVRKRRIM